MHYFKGSDLGLIPKSSDNLPVCDLQQIPQSLTWFLQMLNVNKQYGLLPNSDERMVWNSALKSLKHTNNSIKNSYFCDCVARCIYKFSNLITCSFCYFLDGWSKAKVLNQFLRNSFLIKHRTGIQSQDYLIMQLWTK